MAEEEKKVSDGSLDRMDKLSEADWKRISERAAEKDESRDKWIKDRIEQGKKNDSEGYPPQKAATL